ncbi:MAG: 4Fe-4S binding protein [Victivallales bacterium]
MMNFFTRIRFYTAVIATWLMNLNIFGISFKKFCAPGFNCHGCPWASMACPVGVFTFSSAIHQLPALAISSILAVGLVFGRMACGFICPFGLLQDLLHRIPSPKLKLPKILLYGKYLFLLLFVMLLPFIFGFDKSGYLFLPKPEVKKNDSGNVEVKVTVENIGTETVNGFSLDFVYIGKEKKDKILSERKNFITMIVNPGERITLDPVELPNKLAEADILISSPESRASQDPRLKLYFCTHCPAGTLTAALPSKLFSSSSSGIYAERSLFNLRFAILAAFLIGAVLISRIFCRVMCPLGAIYALTSKYSLHAMSFSAENCISCGKCDKVCPVGLDVRKEVGTPECISCGDCRRVCPKGCFSRKFSLKS